MFIVVLERDMRISEMLGKNKNENEKIWFEMTVEEGRT